MQLVLSTAQTIEAASANNAILTMWALGPNYGAGAVLLYTFNYLYDLLLAQLLS